MIIPILLLAQIMGQTIPPTPAKPELKCEQYQHVYHWPGQCGPSSCDKDGGTCFAVCNPIPEDKCVDDMHEITERDWQALMDRITKLESKK